MSRTKKAAYTKSKAVSKECRNGGDCPYCISNRTHKNEKNLEWTEQQLKEFRDSSDDFDSKEWVW